MTRMNGMLALLLLAGMAGVMPPVPREPEPREPEPDPPEPPREADGPTMADMVSRRCGFHGCLEFARWRPVLTVQGFKWVRGVPLDLNLSVCDKHRTVNVRDILTDDVWQHLSRSIVEDGEKHGRKIPPPARHLSKLDWLPVTPKWEPFTVDGARFEKPEEWARWVKGRAARKGTLPGYVAAEVMDIAAHPGGEEDGVFVFGNASAKWETGDCMSLTDWAWDHEVDLIGWLEVIEAMDRQRDNAGEAP